jgi:hypothetical protein
MRPVRVAARSDCEQKHYGDANKRANEQESSHDTIRR